jgi:molybdopterin converting factor small subunit
MIDKGYLEIEVIGGSSLGFEKASSKGKSLPSRLRFHVPRDDNIYTLRHFISELSSCDRQLGALILDTKTGRLKGNSLVVINGIHLDLLHGLDTPIKKGDRLVLVPFLAGG